MTTNVNLPKPVASDIGNPGTDSSDLAKPHIPTGAGSVVNGVVNPAPQPVPMSQVVNGRRVTL